MAEHRAVRLQTESRANETLRRWHRFLGFTQEGTKRKMMFNHDYDCWAIVREEAIMGWETGVSLGANTAFVSGFANTEETRWRKRRALRRRRRGTKQANSANTTSRHSGSLEPSYVRGGIALTRAGGPATVIEPAGQQGSTDISRTIANANRIDCRYDQQGAHEHMVNGIAGGFLQEAGCRNHHRWYRPSLSGLLAAKRVERYDRQPRPKPARRYRACQWWHGGIVLTWLKAVTSISGPNSNKRHTKTAQFGY